MSVFQDFINRYVFFVPIPWLLLTTYGMSGIGPDVRKRQKMRLDILAQSMECLYYKKCAKAFVIFLCKSSILLGWQKLSPWICSSLGLCLSSGRGEAPLEEKEQYDHWWHLNTSATVKIRSHQPPACWKHIPHSQHHGPFRDDGACLALLLYLRKSFCSYVSQCGTGDSGRLLRPLQAQQSLWSFLLWSPTASVYSSRRTRFSPSTTLLNPTESYNSN